MLYPNLKHKKALKEQVERYLSSQFDFKNSINMRQTLKEDNTHVIDLIIFYNNRKSPIFKVLGVVVYLLLEKYVCVDYLYLQK